MTHSRNKGRTAEREVELILQAAGLQTERAIGGRTQVSGDIAARADGVSLAIEVRRRERLLIPSWCEAHERSTPGGSIPVLVWRANRMPWRAALLLDDLLTVTPKEKREPAIEET